MSVTRCFVPCAAALVPVRRSSCCPTPRQQRSGAARGSFRCAATKTKGPGGDGEDELGGGELLNMLRAEMSRKKEAEDELQGVVDEEKQKLQDVADEMKEFIDNTGKLSQEKANDSFDKAMESINELSSDLEKELEESKKQREKEEEEFYEWEQDMTDAKNEGQFFKGLYEPFFGNKKKKRDQQKGQAVRPMRRRSKVGSWSTAVPRSEPPLFRTFLIGLAEGIYLQKLLQDLNGGSGSWVVDLGVMLLFLATWPFMIPSDETTT
ncbi:hypothetical protein BSKO_01458 [Bryopsis sp. KO-2023]|nr:hypothetical protein BSKO_01458 [Bryopsis sp. KO-2023]